MFLDIYVCVGSSCHLRGSYTVIKLLRKAIESNDLLGKVNLNAAFCLGKCTDGVTIKIGDEIICGVCEENCDRIFNEKVIRKLVN